MTQRRPSLIAGFCVLMFLPAFSAFAAQHASHRHHRVSRSSSSSRVPSLPSRGAESDAGSPVLGRLGVVTVDNAAIVGGRERFGRVLSQVSRGQNLAIAGEVGDNYAVLMIDHTYGFIPKTAVQLLDYKIVDRSAPDTGDSGSADPAAGDTLGHRLVESAQTFLNVPYRFGGETRNGIDCSAFVRAVYAENGISLPRVSGDQAQVGYDVPHDVAAGDWTRWAPGDRLYFACHHPRIDHTAMYIGQGLFIHASVGHDNMVAIDRVDNPYYEKHLVAVRRSQELINEPPDPGTDTAAASTVGPDAGGSSPGAPPVETTDPVIDTDSEASQE